MAAVLRATVVALALIAAQKQFSVAAGSKLYGIKEFLTETSALLVIRTTYGTFNPCKWYQQQDISDTGVTVFSWVYIDSTKRKAPASHEKKWIFKEEDKMWTGDEGPEGDRDEKWLLHILENDSCGVLHFDEIYDSID
nr:uncharacterized protein LOC119168625 [Rhipicephalus microplus]